MTLYAGRAAIDDPTTVSESGGILTLTGRILPQAGVSDANNAARLRAVTMQLLGMWDNPDEDVFSVRSTLTNLGVDGFYQLAAAPTVTIITTGATAGIAADYQLSLRRIPGFSNPLFETAGVVALRTNSHGVTGTPDTMLGTYLASGSTEISVTGAANALVLTRGLDTGGNAGLISSLTAGTYPATFTAGVHQAPANFYDDACKIEYQAADGVWYPVVGRQMPRGVARKWRLGNGMTRLSPGTATGDVKHESYYGGWESFDWQLGYNVLGVFTAGDVGESGYFSGQPVEPTVVCNSRDQATLRFNVPMQQASNAPVGQYAGGFVDLTVLRGHRMVYVYGGDHQPADVWYIGSVAVGASTAITGGIRRTANDANGNQFVFLTPVAKTNDLVNGRIVTTVAAETFLFGVAYINGVSPDTESIVSNEFWGVRSAQTRVVMK